MKNSLLLAIALLVPITSPALAQFTYVGPSGGSFFDETNWEDIGGVNPVAGSLPDSTTGAIALDLIIDGANVEAAGQVDFGAGSLTLINNADFSITGSGNDVDFNTASSFTLTDSSITADGDVVIEGVANFSGGQVIALTDDVEFQDNLVVSIDGTSFSAGDNLFFDAFSGTIVNASFSAADRLGIRNSTAVTITDSVIDIASGAGDIEDVFSTNDGAGSSLTLLGNSMLLADTVEEGIDLIIDDTSTAQLGGGGSAILNNGSTATLLTTDATLQISAITVDPRAFIVDGRSGGVDYSVDSSVWNVTNWDGASAVTLQLAVPEPASLVFALMSICFLGGIRRYSLS